MPKLPDNVTTRFCKPCNRREALHIDGRCTMADRHELRPCDGCGRPTTEDRCDSCAVVSA